MEVMEGCGHSGWKVLRVSGRLDTSTAGELEVKCLERMGDAQQLALDLEDVNYINSTGLRVLLFLLKLLTDRGGRMVLVAPQPLVREVLEVSGFTSLFPVLSGLDELR
jgi:anti-sigma B factor antagonist